MNHDARIEEIFLAALEIDEPTERQSYLELVCATDRQLQQQVERLLAALPRAQDFMVNPLGGAAPSADAETIDNVHQTHPTYYVQPVAEPADLVGTWIGPYKLLQLVAEGGMGSVYLAEQESPVKRRVALKIIKVGMDSRTFTARFEQERQALAMMDHPNIAKVLDAGASESGRPYFAMEFVKGIPITQYCDQQRLSPRQRIELFIPVCQALQHAHQKGVIHRDLKPSNVLVAQYDGQPVPKVIDFGVAKATQRKLTEQTMHTEIGSIVGTLEYMAPEQAEFNNLDIDTRADIYSLGVLLYELLTGSPPFTAAQLRSAEFTEMLRIIREVEPIRPSTRISSSTTLPAIAANRQLEPRRLEVLLSGELDWIVMKCLEKDRQRRYDTAAGLAADLARHLADEPVLAGPPSVGYRARKFLRRHCHAVAAAAAGLVLLLGGIIGTTWGFVSASSAKREAEAGETRAELARSKMRAALDDVSSEAIATLLSQQPVLTDKHRRFLQRTLDYYAEFAEDPGDDPTARSEVAEAHVRMASIRAQLGELAGSELAYRRAIGLWEDLGEQFPEHTTYVSRRASTADDLGWILYRQAKHQAAEESYRNAVKLMSALHEKFPDNTAFKSDLATAKVHLANTLADRAERTEAEKRYRDAIGLLTSIPDPDPESRSRLGNAHYNLGILLSEMGLDEDSIAEYERGIQVYEALTEDHPQSHDYIRRLSNCLINVGEVIAHGEDWDLAEEYYRRGLAIQEKLTRDYPAIPEYRKYLGRTLSSLADELANRDFFDEARDLYGRAIDVKRQLSLQYTDAPEYRRDLASTFNNQAFMEFRNDSLEASKTGFRNAIAIQEPLVESYPDVAQYRRELGNSYGNLGNLLAGEEKFDEAEECIRTVLKHNTFLAEKYPEAPEHLLRQGGDEGNLAELVAQRNDIDGALELYELALNHIRLAQDRMPAESARAQRFLFNTTASRAQLLQDQERYSDALDDWQECVGLAPDSRAAWAQASMALCQVQSGKVDPAISTLNELLKEEGLSGQDLITIARAFSRAMEHQPDKSDAYAEKCLECLNKAHAAEYFSSVESIEELQSDEHLDAIRERAEFQDWLKQIESDRSSRDAGDATPEAAI